MRAVTTMGPGVALCCALALAGEAAATWLGMPVPGAVLGMLVYGAWLLSGRGIAWSLAGAALLLRWLGAMVVPALVGLTAYWGVLAGVVVQIAVLLLVTTLVTAVATAAIYRLAGGRQ
jgi:holin-like protein